MLKYMSLIGLTLLGLQGCAQSNVAATRGVYMLVDTSGTYTEELEKADQYGEFHRKGYRRESQLR